MIGDWVFWVRNRIDTARVTGVPVLLDGVSQHGISVFYNGSLFFIRKEDIEPIPLTAEILEKNGFETEDAKDGGFILCDDFYDIFIYEWSDSIWVARYESTEMNIPFEQATMGYVHELQHFLRASGIEKEVEI